MIDPKICPGEPAELAALHSVGALTDAELTAFEAHLATGCMACAGEVAAFGPVVAELTTAAPRGTPSAKVREVLLERVSAPAPSQSPLRSHVLAEPSAGAVPVEQVLHSPADGPWQDTAVSGVRLRILAVDRARNHFTALVRMAPGSSYPRHVHTGPEECLVLEGDLYVGDEIMHAGDYQHAPVGSAHALQRTEKGCLLYISSSLDDEFIPE